MLAFMAWAIVSGCITGTIFRDDGARNISVLLNGFVIPLLILYLAGFIPQSLTTVRTACTVLTVFLGYLIVTAFCEHFQISWLIFPQYILDPSVGIHTDRARGPVVNAAENGGIMAILLIVALHRVRYAFTLSLRWWATIVLLFGSMVALWFTQTRAVWVALAAGLLIMLIHERCRPVVSALAAIAVFAIPLITLLQIQAVPQRPETTEFRLDLYRESLTAFQDHPITGWGLGTFTGDEHLFDAYGRSTALGHVGVQHDTILAIATDTGAIGAILYISFLVVLFCYLLQRRRLASCSEKRDFYVVCMAAVTVFIVNGVFADCRYFMSQNALVFFITGLGLAIRPDKLVSSQSWTAHGIVSRKGAIDV